MTPYAKHVFYCTADDFIGVQDALLESGAVWVSGLPRWTETPDKNIVGLLVDGRGQISYSTLDNSLQDLVSNHGYNFGNFTVKRSYTLADPIVRETVSIAGQVYDKQDIIAAIRAAGITVIA